MFRLSLCPCGNGIWVLVTTYLLYFFSSVSSVLRYPFKLFLGVSSSFIILFKLPTPGVPWSPSLSLTLGVPVQGLTANATRWVRSVWPSHKKKSLQLAIHLCEESPSSSRTCRVCWFIWGVSVVIWFLRGRVASPTHNLPPFWAGLRTVHDKLPGCI